MIRVTTVHGKTYEGAFYALDPVTKSLALKAADDAYVLINTAHITAMSGSIEAAADVTAFGMTPQNIEQQEQAGSRQVEKSLETLNLSVAGEVQALYDKFSSIYSICAWQGSSIRILDEYLIEAPYDSVVVLPGKDGSGLDRITMILQGERRKLNL